MIHKISTRLYGIYSLQNKNDQIILLPLKIRNKMNNGLDRPCRDLSGKIFNFFGKYSWVNQNTLIKNLMNNKFNTHFLIINLLEIEDWGVSKWNSSSFTWQVVSLTWKVLMSESQRVLLRFFAFFHVFCH